MFILRWSLGTRIVRGTYFGRHWVVGYTRGTVSFLAVWLGTMAVSSRGWMAGYWCNCCQILKWMSKGGEGVLLVNWVFGVGFSGQDVRLRHHFK